MVGGRITAEDLSFKGNIAAFDRDEAEIAAQAAFGKGAYIIDEMVIAPDIWMALDNDFQVKGFVNATSKKEAEGLAAQKGFGDELRMEQIKTGQKVWSVSLIRSSAVPSEISRSISEPDQPHITEIIASTPDLLITPTFPTEPIIEPIVTEPIITAPQTFNLGRVEAGVEKAVTDRLTLVLNSLSVSGSTTVGMFTLRFDGMTESGNVVKDMFSGVVTPGIFFNGRISVMMGGISTSAQEADVVVTIT